MSEKIQHLKLKSIVEQGIENSKTNKKQINIPCGGGLYVVIQKGSGTATYTARIKKGRSYSWQKLGLYKELTLKQAFDLSDKARIKAKEVLDKPCLFTPLLKDYFPNWVEEKAKERKASSTKPQNHMSLFRTTLYPLHDYRLNEITPHLVYKKLNEIEQTANNKHDAVAVLSQCLRGAVTRGIIEFNPLSEILKGSESPFKKPKAKGYKFVKAEDLKSNFFEPLSCTPEIIRCFYAFIALTALRFGECLNLKWEYVDFEHDLIVIPPDAQGGNKTQKNLYKPITKQVKALLLHIQKMQHQYNDSNEEEFVFSLDSKQVKEYQIREPQKYLTSRTQDFHGFRKTMATFLSEEYGIDQKTLELALTHEALSKLEKTYNKNKFFSDILNALEVWNSYLVKEIFTPEFKELME